MATGQAQDRWAERGSIHALPKPGCVETFQPPVGGSGAHHAFHRHQQAPPACQEADTSRTPGALEPASDAAFRVIAFQPQRITRQSDAALGHSVRRQGGSIPRFAALVRWRYGPLPLCSRIAASRAARRLVAAHGLGHRDRGCRAGCCCGARTPALSAAAYARLIAARRPRSRIKDSRATSASSAFCGSLPGLAEPGDAHPVVIQLPGAAHHATRHHDRRDGDPERRYPGGPIPPLPAVCEPGTPAWPGGWDPERRYPRGCDWGDRVGGQIRQPGGTNLSVIRPREPAPSSLKGQSA